MTVKNSGFSTEDCESATDESIKDLPSSLSTFFNNSSLIGVGTPALHSTVPSALIPARTFSSESSITLIHSGFSE